MRCTGAPPEKFITPTISTTSGNRGPETFNPTPSAFFTSRHVPENFRPHPFSLPSTPRSIIPLRESALLSISRERPQGQLPSVNRKNRKAVMPLTEEKFRVGGGREREVRGPYFLRARAQPSVRKLKDLVSKALQRAV